MIRIILLLSALVALAVYFIPALVAWRRDHKSLPFVFCLNAMLGWTFFGWVVALVWAITGPSRRAPAANANQA
jgi:hypothetical protein